MSSSTLMEASSPVAAGPSQEHLQELSHARVLAKPLRKTIRIAMMDGWVLAVCGGMTILMGLSSMPTLLLGCGMCIVAHLEFRGSTRLRRLESEALNSLMWNQIALGSMLFSYALWTLIVGLTGPSPYVEAGVEAAAMLEPIEQLWRLINTILYAAIMVVAIFVQGGTALFYRSRGKHFTRYLALTPQWIIQMQRDGVNV